MAPTFSRASGIMAHDPCDLMPARTVPAGTEPPVPREFGEALPRIGENRSFPILALVGPEVRRETIEEAVACPGRDDADRREATANGRTEPRRPIGKPVPDGRVTGSVAKRARAGTSCTGKS